MIRRIAGTAAALSLLAVASARAGGTATPSPNLAPPASASAPRTASIPGGGRDTTLGATAGPDSAARAAAGLAPFDLSGTWRLDLALSGEPPRSGGHGGGGGRHGGWGGGGGGGGMHGSGGHGHSGGGWGGGSDGGSDMGSDGTGHHGGGVHFGGGGSESSEGGESSDGGQSPAPPPRTPGPLPELMTIKQNGGILNLADSTGAIVVQVTVNGSAPDTAGLGGRVQVAPGRWLDEALQVQRPSWRGSTLLQTFTLEDDGERLVIQIHLDMHGLMPPVDVKRVYDRVGG